LTSARDASADDHNGRSCGPYDLHLGDARELGTLVAQLDLPRRPFITTTITSPPYGNLKDYGGGPQLGWQQDYEEYLIDCGATLQAAFDLTLPEGSLWLIADTLGSDARGSVGRIEPLPFQLAERAEKAGWILRDTIIWRKDRTLPWSTKGRLRNSFEYILFFVKSPSFKYHVDRLREPIRTKEWWIRFPERYNPLGAVPSNVWDIPIPRQGAWGQETLRHACPFPPMLVDRLLSLSTDPGDVVLDPFAGTGTVLQRARAMGRRPLGFDTNSAYIGHFRTIQSDGLSLDHDGTVSLASATKIRSLRALKYARVLYERHLTAKDPDSGPSVGVVAAVVLANIKDTDDLTNSRELVRGSLSYVVDPTVDGEARERLRLNLAEHATRRPASKFGVSLEISVVTMMELLESTTRRRLYLYRNGRFWNYSGIERLPTGIESLMANPTKRLSIFSNLAMSEVSRDAGNGY
jgi:DNA modification methylase